MTLASVTELPTSRSITVPRRTPLERGLLLTWLAAQETERPGWIPRPILALSLSALTAEKLSCDQIGEAWAEYLSAVREKDDAETGLVTWAQLSDDMAPDGRHEDATDIATQNAASALSALVHGDGCGR
jgi:hypothetical protein